MFIILITLVSFFYMKEYTPINKIIDKAEIGATRNEIYSEVISVDTSRNTYKRGEFIYIDFNKDKFLIGVQRSSSGTKDFGCSSNTNFKYKFYETYEGINYLCYENFLTLDNGIRLGFIYPNNENNLSFYSILGGGQGELTTSRKIWGKQQFNYNYLNIVFGLGYNLGNGFYKSANTIIKIEFGYKRFFFDNHFYQKQLTAYMNDYSIGLAVSLVMDFQKK